MNQLAPLFALVLSLASTACAVQIRSLEPLLDPIAIAPELRGAGRIAVVPFRVESDPYGDALAWQRALPPALRDQGLFSTVQVPFDSDEPVDFVLRGRVRAGFEPLGLANFLTWFPGPLIFSHNWRGTRYVYVARADVELLRADDGELVATYAVRTRHELVHRSSNPGPMLGAAIVVPGIIKGALSAQPRLKYRTRIYERAYRDLWSQIATRVAADLQPYYAKRAQAE